MFVSLFWKLVYGVAAAAALALTTYLETATDPHVWSLKSLVVLFTPLAVSAVKKTVAAALVGANDDSR